jgi:hypothetical protein
LTSDYFKVINKYCKPLLAVTDCKHPFAFF